MKAFKLGCCQAVVDTDATKKWYAQYAGWQCDCEHCLNFVELAKRGILPASIVRRLDELGIPPEKPTYVCSLYTDEAGIHYQFSYRIAGTFPQGADQEDTWDGEEGRCCHEPYPYGAPDFPEVNFDLEFYVPLPWVLEEAEN